MTVGTQTPRVEYIEDGATTVFAVPYAFFDDSDLTVTRRTGLAGTETTLVLGVNYSVSGGDTGDGPAVGSITLLTASVADATLRIDRDTKKSQELHYEPGDTFPARSHEDGLDRLEMQIQELIRDEITEDNLAAFLAEHVLKAGAGIRIDYDEAAKTITISATSIEQAIADLPDCVMLSGDQQTFNGEDGESNTGSLTAEDVRDIVAAFLTAGPNVSLINNDLANTLTIGASGGGGGVTLGTLLQDMEDTGLADNQFFVGVGTNDVQAKTITDFALTLLDDADAAAMRTTLGGLLGVSASSLGSPGYIKFTNNLKIQWGSISCTGDATTTVTYPSAYSTFGVPVGSGGYTGHDQPDNCRIISANATGFTITNNDNIAATFWWIAIGI